MMFKLGLIGFIGMGKFIMVKIFVDLGCVVWDVDVVVYWLYFEGGVVVVLLLELFFLVV